MHLAHGFVKNPASAATVSVTVAAFISLFQDTTTKDCKIVIIFQL
jgi:hypothetical protein